MLLSTCELLVRSWLPTDAGGLPFSVTDLDVAGVFCALESLSLFASGKSVTDRELLGSIQQVARLLGPPLQEHCYGLNLVFFSLDSSNQIYSPPPVYGEINVCFAQHKLTLRL